MKELLSDGKFWFGALVGWFVVCMIMRYWLERKYGAKA